MLLHHSKKTANNNVTKLFSLNSCVIGSDRSETAKIRGVDGAHDTPPGPHEHTPLP